MLYSDIFNYCEQLQNLTTASIVSFLGGLVLTNLSSTPPEPYFSLKHVCTLKQLSLTSFIFLYHLR